MADPKTDTVGQMVQPRMITHVGDGATSLTNRDIAADLQALTDDAIKGIMRTLGDAGAAPSNASGKTALYYLGQLEAFIGYLRNAVYGTDRALDTSTPLSAAATYTGSSINLYQSSVSYIETMAYADQAGTLYVEQSWDSTNWDHVTTIAVVAATVKVDKTQVYGKFVRLRYVNGGVDQAAFRLGHGFSIS